MIEENNARLMLLRVQLTVKYKNTRPLWANRLNISLMCHLNYTKKHQCEVIFKGNFYINQM